MTADRSVSVVIPVRNEAARIEACVQSILSQTVSVREIIIVDSGSTDGTLELVRNFPRVRIVSIDPDSFNHGDARNRGVSEADTEWVVLTVGDAQAADNVWLQNLFAGVVDENVAAVCGSQTVPRRPDTNPVDWFNPVSEPSMRRFHFSSAQEFDALTPSQQKDACAWDDVTALYRRDVLLRLPFEPVMYGEDAIWAKAALQSGLTLVYNSAARVHHYHNETADFTFQRTILTLCFRYRSFGFLHDTPALTRSLAQVLGRLIRERQLSWRERVGWLRYNLRNQMAARAAFNAFQNALIDGNAGVENLCRAYSSTPPIPQKTTATDERE